MHGRPNKLLNLADLIASLHRNRPTNRRAAKQNDHHPPVHFDREMTEENRHQVPEERDAYVIELESRCAGQYLKRQRIWLMLMH